MAADFVTLALNGDVPLAAFARAMQHLSALIEALTAELDVTGAMTWVVDELQAGSAVATFRGEPTLGHDVEAVTRVVHAYTAVGHALAAHERPPYSPRVIRAAEAIVALVADRVASVRFETAEADATISGVLIRAEPSATPVHAYGAVEGRIQTLTSRGGLRFTLYDAVYDHAVRCFLEEDKDDLARDAWRRAAIVEGLVSRDPVFGYPVTIRRITAIHPLEGVAPGSYRRARAILPRLPQEDAPEERIRRVRDAG